MLCEKCKKNQATVFYEEIINGNKSSYSLCSACAAEMEKTNGFSGGYGLFTLSDGLLGGLFGQTAVPPKKVCPSCGADFSYLKQTGRVGCPECYTVFGDQLRGIIRSAHGNVKHVGRAPARLTSNADTQKNDPAESRLADLRRQMQVAISEENFELAATLRDEIRKLEETA